MTLLKQDLISVDKYNIKCPYTMSPIGIAIHNTYNNASAKNEAKYMKSNNNQTSFHIVVDDIEAIQVLPLNRNAWACGDGKTGDGNRKYISIEICYSLSGGERFEKAEILASKVVAELLKKYNWTVKNIKAHRNFSNKNCPHRTNMNNFINLVNEQLNELPKDFNVVNYLTLHKDVLLEVVYNSKLHPYTHFKNFGKKEGRVYNNDVDYLVHNKDVLLEVNKQSSFTGEQHYINCGKNEGRLYK